MSLTIRLALQNIELTPRHSLGALNTVVRAWYEWRNNLWHIRYKEQQAMEGIRYYGVQSIGRLELDNGKFPIRVKTWIIIYLVSF